MSHIEFITEPARNKIPCRSFIQGQI